MIKVRCTSSFYVIDKGVFDIHDIVEFDDILAEKLIKQGVVEPIEEKQTEKEEDYTKLTIKELKKLLSNIRSLEKKIKRFSDKQDLIKIQELNDILDWRVEAIMNGKQFSFKVYESMSRYKKMQMYSIFKDKMLDLKCHLYMLKSINSKKGNAD